MAQSRLLVTRTRRRTRPPRRPHTGGRRRGGKRAGGGPQGAEEGETQETGRERRSARRFGSWPRRRRGHDREPTGHARPDDDERLVRDHGGVYSHAPPRDRRVVGNLVGVYIAFVIPKRHRTNILTSRNNIVNKRPLARSHSAPARAPASTGPGRRNNPGTPRRRPRR